MVLSWIGDSGVDTVTLSNVLNVISTRGERLNLLSFIRGVMKRKPVLLFITVYEGNGSGKGRVSSRKGDDESWQENRKLASYLSEVRRVFPRAVVAHGMIIAAV